MMKTYLPLHLLALFVNRYSFFEGYHFVSEAFSGLCLLSERIRKSFPLCLSIRECVDGVMC